MFPVKKVPKSVSYAVVDTNQAKIDRKMAGLYEDMLKRSAEGRIVLSESHIEELKQKIKDSK
jgi:hypothetical protein